MEHDELRLRFTYHPPKNEQQKRVYEDIRAIAAQFAYDLNNMCPDSREKSLAITKLEECVMWANAAIARRS